MSGARKKQRNPAFGLERNIECYVCKVIDPEMPAFAAYPVCNRCQKLTPIELLKLDREVQKRAGLALLANQYFPQIADSLAELLNKKFSLSGGRQRRKRR